LLIKIENHFQNHPIEKEQSAGRVDLAKMGRKFEVFLQRQRDEAGQLAKFHAARSRFCAIWMMRARTSGIRSLPLRVSVPRVLTAPPSG